MIILLLLLLCNYHDDKYLKTSINNNNLMIRSRLTRNFIQNQVISEDLIHVKDIS